ncbi:MAG: 16S rRNA (cytosine(1402)-N(4))-methyltransferase RsmH [Lachnospiraceae bacterium]|nr:16S rRNA (cytosine(1402)-N(4))-methyltransferase RsmH [Lachnospiraceae bacterium]
MEFKHYSVMLNETIENLNIKPDGIYVDGTAGGGGHSLEIAKRLGEGGRLICIDQDLDAISACKARLKDHLDKVTFVHSNYEQMVPKLMELGIDKVDGILLDLGVSSFQLDNPERGFSYMREDEPLDMRMDQTSPVTAADILNNSSESDLYEMIRDYGEEKFARKIAKTIVSMRSEKPFETTGDLNQAIVSSIPAKARRTGGNPCKRTYQAVRIKLNRELSVLQDSMDGMIDILNEDGRFCIITFHSLEDRIVKNDFRKNENPCTCPPEFPVCVCGKVSKGKVVTRKPILPTEKELEENSRSKSAKLRVFERRTPNE